MTNYYYIVASLPAISLDWKFGEKSAEDIIREIRQLSEGKDLSDIDFVESGFQDSALTPDFYRKAIAGRNAFIREYYIFDLNVRNAKVRYLNRALGRDPERDVIPWESVLPVPEYLPFVEDIPAFEEAAELEDILSGTDILERERGIDSLYWAKLDRLSEQHYFDMDVILSFILKLHIIDRWHVLDDATGREMFRRLVDEIRGTFKIQNN